VLGLIVCGDNHFLIRAPQPSAAEARALVRRWTFPSIEDLLGQSLPLPPQFQISTREFRENITWALVLSSSEPHSPAVAQLLSELIQRAVSITNAPGPQFAAANASPDPSI
jgi:hypothetical protein